MRRPAQKIAKSQRRAVQARAGLKGEQIVREAIALIDAEGLDALSMRSLASRLGVEAMSLYHHFPSKAALLTAVSRALSEEVAGRWVNPPKDWKDRIVALGRVEIETILAHPNAVLLLTARSNPGGTGYITIEAMLRALSDSGLDAKACLLWSRSIISLINGVGAFFVPLTSPDSGDLPPPDPRVFPLTAEVLAIRRKLKVDPYSVMERGLRPMLAAIEGEVAAKRA
jgi:AcrR family transcriptional regulator